jgi:hypothetical protein
MVAGQETAPEAAKVGRPVHYMSERRDYVPIAVQVIVSEKLVRSLGGVPAAAEAGSLSWRWRFNMGLASRIKGVTRDTWQLDHDPPLALRERHRRWTGSRIAAYYDPPANDPEHLFYRDDHRTKTFLRGDHGQYSDITLIKRERRRNRPAKPKRKIPSRQFQKRREP